MSRRRYDPEWADEVVRRYLRRKYRVQQRDRAMADLQAALAEGLAPVFRFLNRILG